MGTIHAGKRRRPGGRYDRLLLFLESRGDRGATSWELMQGARVCAVSTAISELRAMGYVIDCREEEGSGGDAKVFRYWLRKPGQGELFTERGDVETASPIK